MEERTSSIPDPSAFDLFDEDYVQHLYDVFARMNEDGPITRADTYGGHWVITAYDEVFRTAQDWETFTSSQGTSWPDGYVTREGVRSPNAAPRHMPPITEDPPTQRVYRRLLNPYFSPEAILRLEATVRAEVNELIDGFIERGTCDLWHEFADPLPLNIFFNDILSLPEELNARASQLFAEFELSADEERTRLRLANQKDLCREIVSARQTMGPQGDVIDAILAAEIDGRRLDFDNCVGVVEILMIGGAETTSNMIATSCYFLAKNEWLRTQLIRDPSEIPNACEEFLRLLGPVQLAGRTVTKPAEIGGHTLCPGDKVELALAAANRDPHEFACPEQFWLDRIPNRHFAFGVGVHKCLGSNLARLVFRLALEQILSRLPDYRLSTGYRFRRKVGHVQGPKELPVTFTAGTRVGSKAPTN